MVNVSYMGILKRSFRYERIEWTIFKPEMYIRDCELIDLIRAHLDMNHIRFCCMG